MNKKDRIKLVSKRVAFLFTVLLLLLILHLIGLGIPCPFYKITGLQCPSCGVTRMGVSLLHGDFKAAYSYNQVLPFILPVLGIYLSYKEYIFIQTGKRDMNKIEHIFLITIIIILLLYGIIRNLS